MNKLKSVFILGNPRSGTSLLRIILNNHPEIVAPPESGFAHWWLKKYKNWTAEDTHSPQLDEFITDILSSKKIETWNLNEQELKNIIIRDNPKNYSELITCIYLAYSDDFQRIKVVADKNNYYIHHLSDLPLIWPEAKYLHIIRDGRDVACSYLNLQRINTNSEYKPVLSNSIIEIAEEWKNNNISLAKLKQEKGSNYHLVNYENLISNLKISLIDICEFLEIDFNDQMLDYYKVSDKNKIEPIETLDWKRKTKEKPDKKNIGKYKNQLSQIEIKSFEKIAGEVLDKFNYPLNFK